MPEKQMGWQLHMSWYLQRFKKDAFSIEDIKEAFSLREQQFIESMQDYFYDLVSDCLLSLQDEDNKILYRYFNKSWFSSFLCGI